MDLFLADAGGIFISNLVSNPRYFFTMTLIVVFSICFHEFCHARVALWMGDDTAASRGHLTLNPLKQMGVISIIMFLILGFAWGAVPVDRQKLRSKYSWGELATALAGPAANLMLFCICWTAFGYCYAHGIAPKVLDIIFLGGLMNCVLFLFNLLPVPGLDGWNAFRVLFPKIPVPNSEVIKGILVFLIFGALFGVTYLFQAGEWVMLKAPRFFLEKRIPDSTRRASLAEALPVMHQVFWNSGPLEARELAEEKIKSQTLANLCKASETEKKAMPFGREQMLVSGEYDQDGFALYAPQDTQTAWLGYRLKRTNGEWSFSVIDDPDKILFTWEKVRREAPMPTDASDPAKLIPELAPKLFTVHTVEAHKKLMQRFVPSARFHIGMIPEDKLRLDPPAATCYFQRISGRRDIYGGRDTLITAELLFCSEPIPGRFIYRIRRPVQLHFAYHDGVGWLFDPEPPPADAR